MKLSLIYTPQSFSKLLEHPALILYIFGYLPITSLCELSSTSKFFNQLSSHPVLWSLEKFELRSWISEPEKDFLSTMHEKEKWRWCFQTFVYGQFIIGLSRNSRVRVPETCILCQKAIKPLVLRWERKRTVRDEKYVANGAELKNDQELLYFHWSCVEPPARFVTHYQVPGYSSLTFEAKQTVREYFEKRKKTNDKQLRKAKENAPFAIVCDSCDRLCGDTVYHCMPDDDCQLCTKCFRMKSTPLREKHSEHGTFKKIQHKQYFNCNNCKKIIKDSFYFCKDCPNGLYLCSNCFRRSRTKNHDENHLFYAIGNSQSWRSNEIIPHPSAAHLSVDDETNSPDQDYSNRSPGNDTQENIHPSHNSHESGSNEVPVYEENGFVSQNTPEEISEVMTKHSSREFNENNQNKDENSNVETENSVNTEQGMSSSREDTLAPQLHSTPITSTSSSTLKNDEKDENREHGAHKENGENEENDSIIDAEGKKRKRLEKTFQPARKRPKKMRRFDELNRRLREDFALRHFLDQGIDINELPKLRYTPTSPQFP